MAGPSEFEMTDDDLPPVPMLPPDDRLWRHPSELADAPLPTGPALVVAPSLTERYRRLTRPKWLKPPTGPTPALPLLLSGLVGALAAFGIVLLTGGYRHTTTVNSRVGGQNPVTAASAKLPMVALDTTNAIEHIQSSVLPVAVMGASGVVYGSGLAMRADGRVATCRHLVLGASTITVTLATGTVRATLEGEDPDTDVALLSIDHATLVPAPLGTDAGLRVGQPAITVGAGHGSAAAPTVTSGVVSGLSRQAPLDGTNTQLDLIQVDRAVTADAVGGGLLDATGSVIGLVCGNGGTAFGYAVPVDEVRQVSQQILTDGKVSHAWLGLEGSDLDWASTTPMGGPGGALVKKVQDGAPAAKVGILSGDVVTAIDGLPVSSMGDLTVALRHHLPGDVVHLSVSRDGGTRKITVTLADRPS